MITSDGWSSRCESGNCVETRTRTVEGHEYVEVRDTETDGTLLVTAEAWEEHEAALRAEGWAQAEAALRAGAERLLRSSKPLVEASVGIQFIRAADYLEALTEVRDDTKGTAEPDADTH